MIAMKDILANEMSYNQKCAEKGRNLTPGCRKTSFLN